MSPEDRTLAETIFELSFIKKTADEFQDFFCEIMEKRYPADFIRVRPWGNLGDRKNDGYLKSTRTLFQVYAPNELSSEACIKKINDDFNEALPHWKRYFDRWVFVHNSRKEKGLGPDVLKTLLELESKNKGIKVQSWSYAELRNEAFGLTVADLSVLLNIPVNETELTDWSYLIERYVEYLYYKPLESFRRSLLRDPLGLETEIGILPILNDGDDISFVEAAKRNSHMLIFGGYGSGKSFLLRWLFLDSVKRRFEQKVQSIPIYLDLSAFPYNDIQLMIHSEISRVLSVRPKKIDFEQILDFPLLLLLDGIDELNSQSQEIICEALSKLTHAYPHISIKVTCRTNWTNAKLLSDLFKRYEVCPLTEKQAKQRYETLCTSEHLEWYHVPYKVKEICTRPIHLQMLINEVHHGVLNLSDTPSKLYTQFIESQLGMIAKKYSHLNMHKYCFDKASCLLAKMSISLSINTIKFHTAKEVLLSAKELNGHDADKLIQGLIEADILRIDRSDGLLSFGHISFRDFFGARFLRILIGEGSSIEDLVKSSTDWFDASLFASGLCRNFIEQCALLDQLLNCNIFMFFHSIDNRNTDWTPNETVENPSNEELLNCLACTYEKLSNCVDPLLRRLLDPFRYTQTCRDLSVSVSAEMSEGSLGYSYFASKERQIRVSQRKEKELFMEHNGQRQPIIEFRQDRGDRTVREINFKASNKDAFCVYEFAKKDFSGEVKTILTHADFAYFTPEMAYEFLWDKYWNSEEVNSRFKNESIEVCYKWITRFVQHFSATSGFISREVFELHAALTIARNKYKKFDAPLIPGPDIPFDKAEGNLIDHCYTPERVLEILYKSIPIILDSYQSIVDKCFPGFGNSLPLRVAMPVMLNAVVYKFEGEDTFMKGSYSWCHWFEPIEGFENKVNIKFDGNFDLKNVPWRMEFEDRLKKYGRNYHVARLAVESFTHGELEIGSEKSIVRSTVKSLLLRDFERLSGVGYTSRERNAFF